MTVRPSILLALFLTGCGAATPQPTTPQPAPPTTTASTQIITPDQATTEPELAKRGELALMQQNWEEAKKAYEMLLSVNPNGPKVPEYTFALATALEGMEQREAARDKFKEVAEKFPTSSRARAALARTATLDAYLEDWKALGDIGSALLAREDADDVDKITALGARGLAKVEMGDDLGASRDVHDGLDAADRIHYGGPNVLPVALAQLRFALGEVKRVRSEKIKFDPLPQDFLTKIEERCVGLLDAQSAYAEAVRAADPHWAAMAGYRVGEMYRTLHHDLMVIPPPPQSKTEKQKQIFFAFMHVRYRVLLEKGLKEIDQTIALGERTNDSSAWIARAKNAKKEMELALADEKAQIAKFPFTEDEIKAALDELAKRVATQKKNERP